MSLFVKATKEQAKLRLALAGPAGSGKTFTALLIASHIAKGGRVAVLDTENGSASKYADLFDFDTASLTATTTGFAPERYLEILHGAEQAGYAVVVIDSLSHEWNGTPGGILEAVDKAAAQMNGNKFNAWARITPRHDALVRAIVESPIHVICTMRSKMDHVQEKDERGRTQIRVVGMKPIQRDELEYEFDIYGLLDQDNRMIVKKSRCPALAGEVIDKPGKETAEVIAGWLSSGITPTPRRNGPAEPPQQPAPAPEPPEHDGDEAPPDESPNEQPVPSNDPRRPEAIARYRQLAAIAKERKHPKADAINAADPSTLDDGRLAASVKALEGYFPDVPETTDNAVPDVLQDVMGENQPPFAFRGDPIKPSPSIQIDEHVCQAARPEAQWFCSATLKRGVMMDFGGKSFDAGALIDRGIADYGRVLCAVHFREYDVWHKMYGDEVSAAR